MAAALQVVAVSLHVIPGLTRDPGPRSMRTQAWIAGRARNDILGARSDILGARHDILGARHDIAMRAPS